MTYTEPTDEQLDAAADVAVTIWAYGSDDEVWEAIFDPAKSRLVPDNVDLGGSINLAAELLERIQRTPGFQPGDLDQQAAIAAILRRYPLLGPPPKA